MSLYATIFGVGDEHTPRCARLKKISRKVYEENDSKPCTCGSCPLIYQESHVLPSDKDKRGGTLSFAAIPSHITRDGRDDAPSGRWWPWLRVSVWDVESDSLVLTRKQVKELRDTLTDWLKQSRPASSSDGNR